MHSSHLPRAKQTAQINGRDAGVKDQTNRNLRPWNLSSYSGHSSAEVEAVPGCRQVDGGESFDTFKDRFLPALEALLKKVDAGKTVGVVTHSRNMELVQGWLNGHGYRTTVDPRAITSDDIDPATVIEVAADPKGKLRMGKPSVVTKTEAHPATLHLRVHGVSNAPGGMRVYRMGSRDGHYVGRTLPTRVRARKGDVLKVETGDFLQDVQGDMRWVNPNVVSHYSDAPHSWRELSALAGGELAKDGAPGPAGDLPPAGDLGASSSMPSIPTLDALTSAANGPTLSDVHVNVPLPDISVSYAGEKRRKRKKDDEDAEPEDDSVLRGEFLPVQKADQMKQLVYGVVLEPNVMDSQDDFMLPHHVEKAAHEYMKRIVRGKASVMKLQHREQGFKKTQPSIVPVESFIAPTDFNLDAHEVVKKGSWVLVAKVEDPALWQDFLDRKYTGFSVGGTGIRRSVSRGNYEPEVPDGYMPQEPADWSRPIPHPDTFGQVLMSKEHPELPPIHVTVPITIAEGAVKLEAPDAPQVHIHEGAIQVPAAQAPDVHIHKGAVQVDSHVHMPEQPKRGAVSIEKVGGKMRLVPEEE